MRLLIKPFFIILCLLLTKTAVSQRVWYAGVYFGTGHYQLYNQNDWNENPIAIYPVKSSPDNWTIGASTTHTWGKHLGLSSGLLYSKNRQDFLALQDPRETTPPESFHFGITNEFKYLKLPVKFQYSTNNNAKHQLAASAGVQASFLVDYREHFLQKGQISNSEHEWHNKTSKDLDDPGNPDGTYSHFLYKRLLLGLAGEMKYQLKFKEGWLLSIGLNGQYDVSNAENRKAKLNANGNDFWMSASKRNGYGGPIEDRPKTHNRSLGLFFSASIPLDIR